MTTVSQRTKRFGAAIATGAVASCLLIGVVTAVQAQTQAEMNIAAGKHSAEADARLNVIYRRLMKKLRSPDRIKLRNAQRVWIKFRDAEATFRAAVVEGGTMYPTVYANNIALLTEARIAQLQAAEKSFMSDGDL